MRAWFAGLVCAGLASAAQAGTIFADDYGIGAPDVVGDAAQLDIRSVEVNDFALGDFRLTLRLNFGAGTLAVFTPDGASFGPVALADVLIEGRSRRWAIATATGSPGGIGGYLTGGPIPTADPLTRLVFPGSLYRVSSFLTAQQVLGAEPSDDYRPDYPVWGSIANPNPETRGAYGVTSLGGSEIQVVFTIPIGAEFYNDIRDGFALHFGGTSCACDVLDAVYTPVPEPGTALLALVGSLALLVRARRSPR